MESKGIDGIDIEDWTDDMSVLVIMEGSCASPARKST